MASSCLGLVAKNAVISRFFAPWCGHCQNLKPAYEKVAKNLEGLAKVAAVNCDDDANKPFCGRMGVQGFPTLKIVVPGSKPGRPRVEDYQGPRSAKAIADAVVERIPNHVKRLTDKDYEEWLSSNSASPKAILFTEKGTTSALLRALAIDFLGKIRVAQIRSKESAAVNKFGITSFPTLLLFPGGETAEPIRYDGELKKQPMVEFLSQVAQPNPDPASVENKKSKAKSTKKSSPKTTSTAKESTSAESVENEASSPAPAAKSAKVDELATPEALQSACLSPKSGTCVLALLPHRSSDAEELSASAKQALSTIAELSHKLASHGLPFYSVPSTNTHAGVLRDKLGLQKGEADTELIAVNGRRGWWRRYQPAEQGDFAVAHVEAWIDAIRLGEGAKSKLPEGVVMDEGSTASTAGAESTETEEAKVERETHAEDAETMHDEL